MARGQYIGAADYQHGSDESIGVLLVNLGTPDAPTAPAVRRYLKQFLSDRRVIEAPRWLWWLILRLAVLPFRGKRSAAAYAQVWTPRGSPLLAISRRQRDALQESFGGAPIHFALAMSYGEPSIEQGLRELERHNCAYVLTLPMYPQYASSTVGSVFDAVTAALARRRRVPHFRFISHYCDDPRYISALADSIADYRRAHGRADKLLFSFHGTPVDMLLAGDPYHCQCCKTARLTAERLRLRSDAWQVSFQSRFGRAVWLQPYTDETLRRFGAAGVRSVQVVCPAFSADCLETLEEIAVENREVFVGGGGESYGYIPALNDSSAHIAFLHSLVDDAVADWFFARESGSVGRRLQADAYSRLRDSMAYLKS